RPRSSHRDGCTVRCFAEARGGAPCAPMASIMQENLELVREISRRLNAGDVDDLLALCHDDVVMTPAGHWLETVQLKGKDAFRKNTEEWLGAWESIEIETGEVGGVGGRGGG